MEYLDINFARHNYLDGGLQIVLWKLFLYIFYTTAKHTSLSLNNNNIDVICWQIA